MATDGETWEPMLTSSAMRSAFRNQIAATQMGKSSSAFGNRRSRRKAHRWMAGKAKRTQVDRQKRETERRAFVTRAGREDPNLELARTKYPVSAVEQDVRLVAR